MDGNNSGQNVQKNGQQKTQLSWSQPLQNNTQKPPMPQNQNNKPPVVTNHKPTPTQNNTGRNIAIAVVLLAIVGIIWLVASRNSGDTTKTPVSTTATTTPGTTNTNTGTVPTTPASLNDGSLSIMTPQDAGLQVVVAHAAVAVPTWVVVYESSNGQPGNILGAALFVPGRTSGTVELLRATLPGQMYFAGEARDDGDHMYSATNDPALRDADGNPLLMQFKTK
ncbi:MAG: hypothetical protein NT019_03270 [Candidatus Adlerbacteria bacterium]|nr:hypothetical protein [Candidatus Adlerbacteria bacterium]